MISYQKLMKRNPTQLGEITNQLGQLIEFYEDPIYGDDAPVIAAHKATEKAAHTDFFDLDDFGVESDYNPVFIEGKMKLFHEIENL